MVLWCIYDNGNYYIGNFKDNDYHGLGTYYYENGKKYYEGEWKDGKQHGQGTQFNPDGTVFRSGNWQDGEFVL